MSETWPGVRINGLEQTSGSADSLLSKLTFLVQDKDYVGEVSQMGHGLQMWLQIIWFLARTPLGATVILDEPDVYMHPDLQRRLFRLVRNKYHQQIIATHSAEIISDASPDDLLVVERTQQVSSFASGLPAAQKVLDSLGGVHNLHIARLSSSKRFLLVEGEDVDVLDPIHSALFPESEFSLHTIPGGEVGGWSGWERAVGAASAMRNAMGDLIKVYCIFDRDYNSKK